MRANQQLPTDSVAFTEESLLENFISCAVRVNCLSFFRIGHISYNFPEFFFKNSSFCCFYDFACFILMIACILRGLAVARKTITNQPYESSILVPE